MVYRRNYFLTLMSSYGDVLKNTEAAINSAGVAMQKQAIYENSLSASTARLKAEWESLYLSAIDNDFMKSFVNSITGLMSGFNTLSKEIGFLPTIITAVVIALNMFGKLNFSQSLIRSVQNFRLQLALLRMEQRSLSTSTDSTTIASSRLGLMFQALTGKTIAQAAASLGLTIATTALNAALTLGLSFAIMGIVTAITSWINHTKQAREEQQKFIQDTQQQIKIMQEEVLTSKEYLETLKSSSSTTDQLTEARKKLSDLFPSIIIGYDNEGKAIIANNESIKEQIALKEQQIGIEKKRLKETFAYDLIQNTNDKKNAQEDLKALAIQKEELKKSLMQASTETESAKQNPALYRKLDEDAKRKIAEIVNEESKLAIAIQETNDKLRTSYVSLMPDMTNFSDVEKRIAEEYIASSVAKGVSQEQFNQGLQYTLYNSELVLAREKELIENSKEEVETIALSIKAQGELNDVYEKSEDKIKDLNEVLSELNKGESLSADKANELLLKYPQLNGLLIKTSEGYRLEAEAINILNLERDKERQLALLAQAGITKAVFDQLELRLKAYDIEIGKIGSLQDAYKSMMPYMASGANSELVNATLQYGSAMEKLKSLKDTLDNPDFGVSKTKAKQGLDPIGYQDVISDFIKASNAKAEEDENQAKSLEKQIDLAKSAKDYNKEIDLTNKLLSIRLQKIKDLQEANKKISTDADRVRSTTKYDTSKWFDPNGFATMTYLNLKKSFEGKTDSGSKRELENINKIFEALQKLKQGYIANSEEISKQNDIIAEARQNLIKSIEDEVVKSIKSTVDKEKKALEDRQKNFKDFIDKRKKLIEDSYSEEENLQNIYDKQQKVLDIQNQMNMLKYANDAASREQMKELTTNLQDAQRDLSKEISSQNKESRINNLNLQESNVSNIIDDKIKSIDDKYTDENIQIQARQAIINGYFTNVNGNIIMLTDLLPQLSQRLVEAANTILSLNTNAKTGTLQPLSKSNINLSNNVSPLRNNIGSVLNQIHAQQLSVPNAPPSNNINGGAMLKIDKLLNIEGSVTKDTLPQVNKTLNNTTTEIKNLLNKIGVFLT